MSSPKPVVGILASGRGSNAHALLCAAEEGRLPARIGVVLSDVPEAPVLATARDHGVPALYVDPGRKGARLTPEQEQALVAKLQDHGVQWIALAGFMRILGEPLLAAYPGRILNIHPSLLPAFPGLDAQGQAFRAGAKVAGCTVHFVDAGVDTGPIIAQRALEVRPEDTEETLRARILELEHTLYPEALALAVTGQLRIDGRRVLTS